jgi:hypothetical protein
LLAIAKAIAMLVTSGLLLGTFFSQSAAATIATGNWLTYTNPTYGFEIEYPPNWGGPDEHVFSDGIYYTHT